MTLREQVADVIAAVQLAWYTDDRNPADGEGLPEELADAVLALVAERERLLRERILAAIDASGDYYIAGYVRGEIHEIVSRVFDDES